MGPCSSMRLKVMRATGVNVRHEHDAVFFMWVQEQSASGDTRRYPVRSGAVKGMGCAVVVSSKRRYENVTVKSRSYYGVSTSFQA